MPVITHLRKEGWLFHQCIGRYPDMRQEEARAEVLKRLGSLANFGKINAPTVRRGRYRYFLRTVSERKNKQNYIGYLRTFSNFRDQKISEVKHAKIVRFHVDMKKHPIMANHAVKALATAISRLYESLAITDFSNPVRNMTLYKEHPRKWFLYEQEAPAIIQELEK